MNATGTARARARAELVLEIKREARRQLAAEGAPALSLRAVARELGMVSSALYRYFPSRDDLLTALIVDAYDAVGEVAERANATRERDDIGGRWLAVCRAIRRWALAHPHEYALVYGSPVPGYRAPTDTIPHASRVPEVLSNLLADAATTGRLAPTGSDGTLDAAPVGVATDIAHLVETVMHGVPPAAALRGVIAWTQLFGLISFELFGQLENTIEDRDGFFDQSAALMAGFVGLPAPPA